MRAESQTQGHLIPELPSIPHMPYRLHIFNLRKERNWRKESKTLKERTEGIHLTVRKLLFSPTRSSSTSVSRGYGGTATKTLICFWSTRINFIYSKKMTYLRSQNNYHHQHHFIQDRGRPALVGRCELQVKAPPPARAQVPSSHTARWDQAPPNVLTPATSLSANGVYSNCACKNSRLGKILLNF